MNPKITKHLGKLCLGVMILYGVPAHPQSMNETIHASYVGFDSTRLSTPFLLNRSLNVMNLEGSAVVMDSTPFTTRNWLQSYMDLRSSQYASVGALSLSPTVILQNMDEYRKNNLHPIGLLAKNVNLIPQNFFDDGSINYDSVTGTFGFSNFEYDLTEMLVITAAPVVPLVEGGTLNLILEQDFMFTDIPLDSMFISIPAIGLVKKIALNTLYPIDISDMNSELTDFTVYLNLYSGSRLYRRGMYFKRLLPINQPDEIITDFSIPNACWFHAPKGYGDALVYVLYSDIIKKNNQTITKPLILVEGYDPSSMDYGAIRWSTFSTGHSYNELGEDVYPQLLLMPELLTELTDLGYDILMVNFKTSSNHIENNAATLAKIIQWAKYKTQGNADVTLMGASMGGMLSQTAMNLLDKSGCNTCVGTYVSFDAPYHGANIPMGIQESAKFFYENLTEAILQYEYKLNVPAAKELLYQHVNQNSDRQSWLNTFSQMNKKLAAFNICLASSSQLSILNGINDGEQLISWEISNSISEKTYLYLNVYSANRSDHLVLTAKVPTSKNLFGTPKTFATYNAYHWPTSYNYDGMPASKSNFIGEMFEQLEEADKGITGSFLNRDGPALPKGPDHSFVPTVSALDYYDKNPLATFDQDQLRIPNTYTPFDYVHFSSQNDFHVFISYEQINHLISSLSTLIGSQNDLSQLPFNSSSRFNCGKNKFSVFGSVLVQNSGVLSFNDYSLTNYGQAGSDLYPSIGKIYARTTSCNAHVRCEANGSIILGGTQPNGDQLKAEVEFRKGSILELRGDAVLKIREGSTLIIDEGALLIIHQGAQIILEGENAVLELRGTVRLENNALFTFSKGTAAKGGFVRFNYKDNAANHFELIGPNCKINLTGDTYFNDKIAEIQGNTSLILPNVLNPIGTELAEFKLKDGVVAYNGNGKIDAACPIRFENVDFEQTGSQQGIALITHGQASVIIENCIFSWFNLGIIAINTDMGSDFLIKNNRFYMCGTGLETHGRKTTLDGNEFSTCGFGLRIDGTSDVLLQGTDFIYNIVGLETSGTNPHVRAEGCWFLRNHYGIYDAFETKFTFSCTPFEQNLVGVSTNGKVNMSPAYFFPGQTLGGQNNTFFQNQTALELNVAEIHLVNGENNFTLGTSSQVPNYLTGSLTHSPLYLANNILDVSGNYFDNIPSGGISAGTGTLYNLLAFGGSGVNGALVMLNGALLNSINTTCFSLIRAYPDNKAELLLDPEEYDHAGHARLDGLKAYPNPTEDVITLEAKTETSSHRTVILYDMTGKEIHRTRWTLLPGVNRTQLSLRELAEPGVYLIKIIDNSGDYQVLKINLTY